jgi:hypothetical protein
MSIRQQKGLQIAQRGHVTRQGRLYIVPSQSGKGRYKVDPDKRHCTCPDFDFRREPCKHLFAVLCASSCAALSPSLSFHFLKV